MPSAECEEFLNSKMPTNTDLRGLNAILSGRTTPSKVTAHVRTMIGVRQVSPLARAGLIQMAKVQDMAN